MLRRLVTLGLLLAAAVVSPARAQDYPSRPITIVVPLAPGGGTDFLARLLAKHLEQRLGKPVLVENKPGASNIIAAVAVAKAEPDGHTLMMGTASGLAINVSMRKNLPYDPPKDFVPLAAVAQVPFVLMVNPGLPVKSVTDLIKYAKDNPGKLAYGSAGPGTPHHLFMEMFNSTTGTQMNHVPYKGSLPAVSDVAAGHLGLMFCDYGPAAALLQGGKVRALGVSTKIRISTAQDIPTLDEAGVKGFDAAAWQMLVAPAKTPQPILAKLHAELTQILLLPEVKDALVKFGYVPMQQGTIPEMQRFIEAEIKRWGPVVHKAGLAGSE